MQLSWTSEVKILVTELSERNTISATPGERSLHCSAYMTTPCRFGIKLCRCIDQLAGLKTLLLVDDILKHTASAAARSKRAI
jgi:hypothetical protein